MGFSKNKTASLAPVLAAVAAGLVLVAAFVVYLGSRTPGDDSAEAGFARDMMVHHAQAVEMAEILRDKTESGEMRTLTADIALTQQAQIGQMQGWLSVWDLPITGTEPQMAWMGHQMDGQMPGMATPKQINTLRNAPPEETEKQFLRLMIPHHKAALEMSDAALARTDHPEVRRLAHAIKNSQQSEIKVMQNLLEERGGEPQEPENSGASHDSHSHEH